MEQLTTTPEMINGRGQVAGEGTAIAALMQFYQGFNDRNLDQVSENWRHGPQACMSNPLGGVKRGWHDIAKVYRRLFTGDASVYMEFHDYEVVESASMFVATGRERGYFKRDGVKLELSIRTSRIYQRHSRQQPWKQLHHHGSMDDPELLRRYQRAVFEKL